SSAILRNEDDAILDSAPQGCYINTNVALFFIQEEITKRCRALPNYNRHHKYLQKRRLLKLKYDEERELQQKQSKQSQEQSLSIMYPTPPTPSPSHHNNSMLPSDHDNHLNMTDRATLK